MRRFFRFSTRDLLILLAAVGLLLAVISPSWHRARQERQRVLANAALLAAAKSGDAEAAQRALQAGANVEAFDLESDAQNTGYQLPLQYAIAGGHLGVLDVLAEAGCDPSHPMHLSRAAQYNRPEVVEWLLAAGKGEGIEGAAQIAATHGHIELLRVFIDDNERQKRRPGNLGGAASAAAANGHLECLRILLAAGAHGSLAAAYKSSLPRPQKLAVLQCLLDHRPAARREGYDDTKELAESLDHAVREVDAELGDLLRKAGAKFTLREAIAFDRRDDVRRMLAEEPERLQTRLRPDYWMPVGREPTPLGMAARLGRREIALELIALGARVDQLELYEETMLHMAARGGDAELIKMLLARGLDVNAVSESGTSLSIAVWREHEAAVQTLLDAGADVNVGTRRGPIHSAIQRNSLVILQNLIDAGADLSIRYPTDSSSRDETIREFAARLGHAAAVEIIDEALRKRPLAEQAAPGSDPPK